VRGWAWWLISAVLLLLLAVTALGLAFTFLDPNDYKTQIVSAVEQATGRTLTLGGPLRIAARYGRRLRLRT
jgi:AsmA protein